VCRLAAATLLARRWPAKGSRNDAALALAGGLLRGGFDTGESGWFLGQVARAAGDDEWRERIATAEYTAARLAKKQPATGWPTLAELVGEKVVEKVREGLGMRDAEKESPPTQAEVLVGYADTVDLFHDPDWVGCASFEVNGHQETHPLRSQGVRRWLLHRYFRDYRKPPGSQALQDAVDTLEARAVIDGPERETHLRVAGRAGAIYVDLCNDCWEVVEVCADGWRVMPAEAVPVRFRRAKGMQPLPHPVSGGSLDGLRKLMNLPDDEKGWVLSVAWLVAAFRPEGPYPVLILQGEQGTAKSTAQRILRAIVDPSTTPLRTTPREMRDLMIAANNGWVVSFDNLSGLPIWLSDGLCRLATGGGFATRELYSDAEEVLFDATRPACLNGITGVATRPDLLDRSLIVELPVIPEERRRPERELWDEFAGEHPMILGILLDAVSGALAKADSVELPRLPRMADFAIWTTAAEEALGWEAGTFMAAYDESREETVAEALEGDLVAGAVLSFMKDRKEWIGKSAELLKELGDGVDPILEASKTWPKTASHLSSRLKRLAPSLRAQGLGYEDWREAGGTRERKKRLWWQRNPPPEPSEDNEAGTVPGGSEPEERPTQEPHRGADDRQVGRHGTARDDAPHPHSDGTGTAWDDPGTTAQQQTSANLAEAADGEHAEAARYPSPRSGGAEDRPGSSLPSRTTNQSAVRREQRGFLVTAEEVPALLEEVEAVDAVALDLETTGLDPRRDEIRLLSLATPGGIRLIDCSKLDLGQILAVLAGKRLIVHNGMFDLLFLRRLGYAHGGRVTDTMILSRMVHAGERGAAGKRLDHSLEACCERELGLDLDKTHQKADWSGELSDEMLRYAAEDARILLLLHEALARKIRKQGQERAVAIEERVLPAVIEMAHAGVPADKERWLRMIDEAKAELEDFRAPLDALAGAPPEEVRKKNANNKNIPAERNDKWNWDSPEQVKAAVRSVGLKLEKTGIDHLKRVDHDLARALLSYKEARGNLGTYGEKFFEPTKEGREVYTDGRINPSWRVCEADTGRMSCAEPNMQNIPSKSRLRELRACVVAPEGRVLVVADYSQIELRVAAKIAGEEAMLEAYREGKDLHGMTARSVTGREEVSEGERKLAKAVNFGLLYGQGAEGLRNYARNSYGVEMSLSQAERYRRKFFKAYPAIRSWHRKEGKSFDAGAKTAQSLTGRVRRVGRFTEKINHPVQGTAADGMKMALALLWERRTECPSAVPILAVHDEIVIECDVDRAKEAKDWLVRAMKDGMDAVVNKEEPRVPIEVEASISKTWGD
jgi:DNA polymerase I-like protein with 3'-5' exonuclease and polymerase domains